MVTTSQLQTQLNAEIAARKAPLSAGIVSVRVSRLPVAPATDAEGGQP
jgi:hypothetical protein